MARRLRRLHKLVDMSLKGNGNHGRIAWDKMAAILQTTFLKCIFMNEKFCITIPTSRKFVSKDPIDNKSALTQVMAWRRPGDKPLSEPMMASLLTHICVNRPQWVKGSGELSNLWFFFLHLMSVRTWLHLSTWGYWKIMTQKSIRKIFI